MTQKLEIELKKKDFGSSLEPTCCMCVQKTTLPQLWQTSTTLNGESGTKFNDHHLHSYLWQQEVRLVYNSNHNSLCKTKKYDNEND